MNVIVYLTKLCEQVEWIHDINNGLEYIQKASTLFEQLYRLSPESVEFSRNLGISYDLLDQLYQAVGEEDKGRGVSAEVGGVPIRLYFFLISLALGDS